MTGSESSQQRTLYQIAAIAAFLIVAAYIAITALYVLAGAPPEGGAAWLAYLEGKATPWWSILGLSVLTDVLFLPLVLGLVLALRATDLAVTLAAAALVVSFVVLDLAVTWPNFAALIMLATEHVATADEAARAADVAAANYPAAVIASPLFGVYAILVPALGLLAFGWAMRTSSFGRGTAYLGVLVGFLGIVTVVGSLVSEALGALAILTSILTTVWVLLAGYGLLRLTRP